MIGPYKEYGIAYNQYASLNMIRETMLGLMLGKKHKPEKAIPFHEMFPNIDEYMYLGNGSEVRRLERENKSNLASKAMAIFADENAPEWLRNAV